MTLTIRVRRADLTRLDHMAARRRVPRDRLVQQAIDEMLAQEAWSGGFIAAPPPMQTPAPFPDRSGVGRRRRR